MKVKSVEFFTSAVDLNKCPAGSRPEVALAGRSNVGKSSLINTLVNRRGLARVSSTPGRTRSLNFFLINNSFFLVDLPGYGYARVPEEMRRSWGPMVESYLTGRPQLRGVVLLVDARLVSLDMDRQLCDWLKSRGIPLALVATKADKLGRGQAVANLARIKTFLGIEDEPALLFSARTGQGVRELWSVIDRWVAS